nr:uncharacterized protein LOC127492476 [Oryctolagus cuniculus]
MGYPFYFPLWKVEAGLIVSHNLYHDPAVTRVHQLHNVSEGQTGSNNQALLLLPVSKGLGRVWNPHPYPAIRHVQASPDSPAPRVSPRLASLAPWRRWPRPLGSVALCPGNRGGGGGWRRRGDCLPGASQLVATPPTRANPAAALAPGHLPAPPAFFPTLPSPPNSFSSLLERKELGTTPPCRSKKLEASQGFDIRTSSSVSFEDLRAMCACIQAASKSCE